MAVETSAFSRAERDRFHALLKLAAESPYEGERENALAAAGRLAAQHGMTLKEAARDDAPPQPRSAAGYHWRPGTAPWTAAETMADTMSVINLTEHQLYADKLRREAALKEAFARGLDAGERSASAPGRAERRSSFSVRRNPHSHAHVLLAETALPLQEIVSMTGLDIYEVVGMKLKMRRIA